MIHVFFRPPSEYVAPCRRCLPWGRSTSTFGPTSPADFGEVRANIFVDSFGSHLRRLSVEENSGYRVAASACKLARVPAENEHGEVSFLLSVRFAPRRDGINTRRFFFGRCRVGKKAFFPRFLRGAAESEAYGL